MPTRLKRFRSCALAGAFPCPDPPRFTVRYRSLRSPRGPFLEFYAHTLSSWPDFAENGRRVNPIEFENRDNRPETRMRMTASEFVRVFGSVVNPNAPRVQVGRKSESNSISRPDQLHFGRNSAEFVCFLHPSNSRGVRQPNDALVRRICDPIRNSSELQFDEMAKIVTSGGFREELTIVVGNCEHARSLGPMNPGQPDRNWPGTEPDGRYSGEQKLGNSQRCLTKARPLPSKTW